MNVMINFVMPVHRLRKIFNMGGGSSNCKRSEQTERRAQGVHGGPGDWPLPGVARGQWPLA